MNQEFKKVVASVLATGILGSNCSNTLAMWEPKSTAASSSSSSGVGAVSDEKARKIREIAFSEDEEEIRQYFSKELERFRS